MIRGIVFDIDDTLYLERDYVRSGFQHVARLLATSDVEALTIANWLLTAFNSGVRRDTFDQLLAGHPELFARATVADLVAAYRCHRPNIEPMPGVTAVLGRLRKNGLRLGALSDGPLVSQEAKAEALILEEWLDPILLTAGHAGFGKPATAGFEWIAREWRLEADELAYVADNPDKDFVGPRALGWRTVRIRLPGQIHYDAEPAGDDQRADSEVPGLREAVDYLGS